MREQKQKVREEWEKQLGVRDAATVDDLWAEAEEAELVDEVLCYSWQVEDLVEHSKRTLKWWRKREGRTQVISGGRSKEPVQVSLKDAEKEREKALEEYLAMHAASDSEVYSFRKEVLGEGTLSKKQAWELLKSPAAAILETRLFKSKNIPIVGHTAEVKRYDPQGTRLVATLAVHPPGIIQEAWMPTWAGTPYMEAQRPVVLEFPGEEGRITEVKVWSISLLGNLREVGEILSKRYRWQPAQAVWFVLTGEIPAVPALAVTRSYTSSKQHRDALITIEASPWISSRTVERAFRKAQIKTLGSGGGRPPGEKNLKLLRFVIERTEPLGMLEEGTRPPGAPEHMVEREELITEHLYMKVPTGKELVSEWNETYPQWSYGSDTRRFWRDYNRIRKAVAFGPPYEW